MSIDYNKVKTIVINEDNKFFPFIENMIKENRSRAFLKLKDGISRPFFIKDCRTVEGKKSYIIEVIQEKK